jgi:hypothetical protein
MVITHTPTTNTLTMVTDIIMTIVTIVSLAKALSGAVNIKGRADTLSLASITPTVTKIKIGMLTAKRIIEFSNKRVGMKTVGIRIPILNLT